MQVTTAASAEQALLALGSEPAFDLLLSDIALDPACAARSSPRRRSSACRSSRCC
jgi:CheY-like chemotaxis protein